MGRANRALAVFIAVWLSACGSDETEGVEPTLTIAPPALTEGVDFTLPDTVQPLDESGWFVMGTVSDNPDIRHVGRTYTWAETNPAAGSYDFSAIEQDLSQADELDRGLIARLKCSVTWRDSPWDDPIPFIPQWVLDECDPPRFFTADDIEVAAPWDDCVQQRYRTFVEQFGTEGLIEHPRLMGLYVHAISSSFGEESWLTEQAIAAAEAAGMNPDNYRQAFVDRIAWWSQATGAYASKLAWVGGGVSRAYRDASDAINAHAVDQGLGWRGGGLEVYHSHIDRQVGVFFDEADHLVADPSFPIRAEGRYFGEEIEIYEQFPADTRPLMFMSSLMRAVQLGLNFLWTSDEAAALQPELVHWYTLVAGRRAQSMPEATCWLREDYVRLSGQEHVWRNFESYLEQRDVEGGHSRAVQQLEHPPWWMDWPDRHYDFSARATDAGAGQRFLAFFLDEAFRGSLSGPIEIAVVYLDDSTAQWQLVAGGPHGTRVSSDFVQGTGDSAWRTATFALSTPPRAGAFETGEDFRVEVVGDEDLTVRFVRVIR